MHHNIMLFYDLVLLYQNIDFIDKSFVSSLNRQSSTACTMATARLCTTHSGARGGDDKKCNENIINIDNGCRLPW